MYSADGLQQRQHLELEQSIESSIQVSQIKPLPVKLVKDKVVNTSVSQDIPKVNPEVKSNKSNISDQRMSVKSIRTVSENTEDILGNQQTFSNQDQVSSDGVVEPSSDGVVK